MTVNDLVFKVTVAMFDSMGTTIGKSHNGDVFPLEIINYINTYYKEMLHKETVVSMTREPRKFFDFPC